MLRLLHSMRRVRVSPRAPARTVHVTRLVHVGLLIAMVARGAAAAAQGVFPPPPAPSIVVARRVTTPIVVDGNLNDSAWSSAERVAGFRQIEPAQGEPSRFESAVMVLFDDRYIYIGMALSDTLGASGVRVPDLRRDFGEADGDMAGVLLDTFRDGRSAVAFLTNPYGAQRDLQAFDDQGRLVDVNWDAMWRVRTRVSDSGWTAEMAIPWTTLRYPAGNADWGVNFVRMARRGNELSGWSPWPRAYSGLRMSYAGRVVGLEPPPPSTNLRLQPYAILRADRLQAKGSTVRTSPDVGGDVKWAITPNTVVDVTLNTDFAQAEADIQQVNLGRFSIFFPEKRQFFLENGSLFSIGGGGFGGEPFFSRRMGLDAEGEPVPIDVGVRLTNRSVSRSVGLLGLRQRGSGDTLASTFGVARIVQNFGAENRLGALIVNRTDEGGTGVLSRSNTVAAVDGFIRPTRSSYVRAMASASFTGGVGGEGTHAYVHAASNPNFGYFGWIQSYISEGFVARTGFVPRENLLLTSPAVSLDFRPRWRPAWLRNFNPGFSTAIYHRSSDGRFQEGNVYLYPLGLTFRDGSSLRMWAQPERQDLESEFSPLPELEIAPGRYDFVQYGVTFRPDVSRRLWAWVTLASGGYFDGRRDKAIVRIRTAPSPHVALTLDYEGNWLREVGAIPRDATTHLFYPELRVALDPRVQLIGLWQYSSVSQTASWNARLAWEFRPLSHVYLVFTDRDFRGDAEPGLRSERRLILKLSYLGQL